MAETPGGPIPGGPPLGTRKTPLRGAFVVGAASDAELAARLQRTLADVGVRPPAPGPPTEDDLAAPVRIAIDYGDVSELADAARRAVQALHAGMPAMWRVLRNRGVYLGRGSTAKTAFLYPGLNSQYVNMLAGLRATEPIVAEAFVEADRFLTPILGRPLTDYLFVHTDDAEALKQAEQQLLGTHITQPAMLTADLALTRLLAAYGVRPDMLLGHSLGEYAALVAAGTFTLRAAIEAAVEVVHARIGRMVDVLGDDPGAMAAVLAPTAEVERVVRSVDGYVVIANVNSNAQAVVGGATTAVESATKAFKDAGYTTIRLPVSHAFHTPVTPAYGPLKRKLLELGFRPPVVPVVANATGEFYPAALEEGLDLACREIDDPVQFVKGLHTLYTAGARVFVEVGPKKVLHGFAEDVVGSAYEDAVILFTNHPKFADALAFNRALCGLYAAGCGGPAVPVQP